MLCSVSFFDAALSNRKYVDDALFEAEKVTHRELGNINK